MQVNTKEIVNVARKYIGEEETTGNSGFKDQLFQKRLEQAGWFKGASWCAFFVEMCCKEANNQLMDEYTKLFSGSATATYANFEKAGYVVNQQPAPGALAVWRHGNTWKGHIGIVTEVVDDKVFKCVEGNTNNDGSREGYLVAEKKRHYAPLPFKPEGLNLIGFIHLDKT